MKSNRRSNIQLDISNYQIYSINELTLALSQGKKDETEVRSSQVPILEY